MPNTIASAIMEHWLLNSALLTIAYQMLFFSIAYYFRFDKVTDFAGTSNFSILAFSGFFLAGRYDARSLFATLYTTLWALRLGFFLVKRVLVRRRDARFDKMRDSFVKFAGFWILQAIWVYITSLPVTLLNATDTSDIDFSFIDQIGLIIWGVGLLIEAIADQQRYKFNQQTGDPRGKPFLDTGLWHYSRHPNYFGEILVWTGVSISAFYGLWHVSRGLAFLVLLSPLTTAGLLIFVSGIPLAEARDDKKHHTMMAYKQYKFYTSVLVLMPREWYGRMPLWVKKWILWDRYQLAFITPQRDVSAGGNSPRSSSSSSGKSSTKSNSNRYQLRKNNSRL